MNALNRTVSLHPLLAVALFFVTGVSALAGGARIPDQSTRAMGMGDAFVAGADDASAVYYNPAGLTRLPRPELIGNLYLAHADIYYSGPRDDDTSDGRYYFIPSVYFGAPIGKHGTAVGLGVYSPFGLGSKWSDNLAAEWAMARGPGASATKLSELQMIDVNPVVAQRLTDTLSVGFGVNYYMSRVVSRSETSYGLGTGETDLDADGDGWGFNAGVQWQCTEQVSLGLVYRSEFKIRYDGTVDYDGLPPAFFGVNQLSYDANAELTFPASLGAGVCWKPTERLRLELAAEWMDWSRWDERTVTVGGIPGVPGSRDMTTKLDWKDSWIVSLGSEYQLTEKWTLRGALMYNQTPVRADTSDVDLPTGDTYAVALGAGYKFSASVSADVAAIVAYGTERTLDHSSAPAGSEFSAISFYLSLGITYRF